MTILAVIWCRDSRIVVIKVCIILAQCFRSSMRRVRTIMTGNTSNLRRIQYRTMIKIAHIKGVYGMAIVTLKFRCIGQRKRMVLRLSDGWITVMTGDAATNKGVVEISGTNKGSRRRMARRTV